MAVLKSTLCGRDGCGLMGVFAPQVNPFLLHRSKWVR
jgi:hypothetical protein